MNPQTATSTEVADRLEIHELISRYYTYVDADDADAWTSLWVEDGEFDSGMYHFKGRTELHAFMMEHGRAGNPARDFRHYVSNVIVDFEGETAHVSSYMLVVRRVERSETVASARCQTEVRKESGQWRIVRHVYRADPSFRPAMAAS